MVREKSDRATENETMRNMEEIDNFLDMGYVIVNRLPCRYYDDKLTINITLTSGGV